MWGGSWNTSETIKKKVKAVSQSGSNVRGKKHIENKILLWKLCVTLIRSLLWQHTVKWSPDWNLLKVQLWTLLPFRSYHVLLLWALLWCFMQKHLVHTHLATGFWKPQPGRRTMSVNLQISRTVQCIQLFWSQTLFGFKRWVSHSISPKFSGKAIWCRRFEPGLFQGFSRHLASRHLNLSRYSSHVLLCRTQANSSHFKIPYVLS